MFRLHDTINPLRILNAVKKFLIDLGERGEVGAAAGESAVAVEGAEAGTGTGENWRDTLPADIKAHPVFEKYKDANEAHRALADAQKFLGREKLPVPKDANDKETYDLIFKTLGLPENENGYELPKDIGIEIPKELPVDETMIADFRKVAHQHGVLPQQFAGLYKWYMTTMTNQYNKLSNAQIEGGKTAETELRKEYGTAYGQKEALARKVVSTFADKKAMGELTNIINGKGNNPGLFKMFVKIGEAMSEDQLTGRPLGLTMTPDEAQSEINKIKGDMKHPYWVGGHPAHDEAVEKMAQLTKMMVG